MPYEFMAKFITKSIRSRQKEVLLVRRNCSDALECAGNNWWQSMRGAAERVS